MTLSPDMHPGDLKVFLNHVYEFKKGRYEAFAVARLQSQHIAYLVRPVDESKINLFFGKPECIHAIACMVDKPLNRLTPEEDFILGAMLGYDLCAQCKRYCARKSRL